MVGNNLKGKQPLNEKTFEIDIKIPKIDAATQFTQMKMKLRSASKIETSNSNGLKEKKRKYVRKFNFPSLPYVCQRRFAEICDFQTLKTFASINSETRILSRHLHVVEKAAVVFCGTYKLRLKVKCYCTENEYCNKDTEILLPPIKAAKIKIMNLIPIVSNLTIHISNSMLINLPVNFDRLKKLGFINYEIHLNELKKFIKPELKELSFDGSLRSPCNIKDFVNFINDLSNKLDRFFFNLYRNNAPFNFKYLNSHGSLHDNKSIAVYHFGTETVITKKKK